MKHLLSILIILAPTLFFSQNYDSYHLEYKVYKINQENKRSNSNLGDLIKKDNDTIIYNLYFSNNKGLFKPIDKINNSQSTQIDLTNVFKKSKGEFYFDNEQQWVQNKKDFLGKNFIVEYSFDQIKWEIEEETDSISHFLCKKAISIVSEPSTDGTKDYKTTVWFTDFYYDIFPFGLAGLNGLVVKAIFNNRYAMILHKISKHKEKEISEFKGGQRISLEDYNKIIDDFFIKYRERNSYGIETDD